MNPYLKLLVNTWEGWAEIPAEGDLECKLDGQALAHPSTAEAALAAINDFTDLAKKVYNSVKRDIRQECFDCVHAVILAPYSPNGNHLVLIYPGKELTGFAQDILKGQGYDGSLFVGHLPKKGTPISLATPFYDHP